MNTGERIRKLRKTLDLTQQKFGERIGVKGNTIAQYELGRNEPVDAVFSLICREFNVNEEWLRTGNGDMFVEIPEKDMYSMAAESLLKSDDVLAIEGLKLYYSLSPEQKAAAINYISQLADRIRAHKSKNEATPAASASAGDAEDAYIKSISDSARNTGYTASNTTDGGKDEKAVG